MAYDIGPRIGIQGEKEFNDSIKKINNSLRECGSEMKALSAEYEDNANSQDALIAKNKNLAKEYDLQQQKMKLLQDQYTKQTSKLKDLANELEKARREYGETSTQASKAEAAFNRQADTVTKLNVSINETQSYLNKLDNTLSKNNTMLNEIAAGTRDAATGMSKLADGAKDANEQLDEIANNTRTEALETLGDTVSEVGDKLKDLGGKTVEAYTSLESTVTRVNAYFGLTGDAAEQMGGVVENVFRSGVTDSLERVGEAVIFVNNNLKDLDPRQLEKITEQAITLEDVFGSDLSETMRGVNSLMVNFGLDAQTAMDYVVAGSQNGLDKTQELGDNLSEYAGKFSQAGYSARDYFQLLQNGLDAGAYNLDKVNDSINEVTTRLADGTIADALSQFSDETQAVFAEWQTGGAKQKDVINSIVDDIKDAATQEEALALASVAFGTMGEDANLDVVTSLNTLGLAYNNVEGAAEQLSESTTTPMQEMQAAFNDLQLQLAPLGAQLMALDTQILPPVLNAIISLIQGFLNLPHGVQTAILVIGGLIAVLSSIAPLITGIISVVSAVGAPVIAIIAAVVAAIGLIIGILTNLWNTNESFRDSVLQIWPQIQEAIGTAIDIIKDIFQSFSELTQAIWEKWGDTITVLVTNFLTVLTTLINDGLTIIREIINLVLALIQGDWTAVGEALKNIVFTLINWITTFLYNWIMSIITIIKEINPELGAAMETAFQAAIDFITSLPGKAVQWGKDFIQGLIDGINSMVDAVTSAVSGIADAISSFLHFSRPDRGPLREYEKWMPDFISGMAQGIYQNISKIQDAAAAVSGTIDSAITGQVMGMADSASYSREMMIVVDGDTIALDGKTIGKTATKYITTGQVAGAAAQGRRLRNVQHNVQR